MILIAILAVSIAVSSPQPADTQKNGGYQSPPTNYQTDHSPNPSAIPNPNGSGWQQKEESAGRSKSPFLSWSDRYQVAINLGSAVCVAFFTGVLTIYTVKLWKSGEKHSERELRAYVGVAGASIKANRTKSLIKAEMTIRNAGQTPAYDFNLIATFDFHEIPRTEFAPYQSKTIKQSRGTLDPGGEVVVPLVAEKFLTPEDLKAVKEEKFAFFFYGKIKYTDAFGKDRFRDFRYIAGNDKSGSLTWQVTEEGNKSD